MLFVRINIQGLPNHIYIYILLCSLKAGHFQILFSEAEGVKQMFNHQGAGVCLS